MRLVMIISCLILIFSTLTQITQEMGMHTFDTIRSTHGLLIFSITSSSENLPESIFFDSSVFHA